MPRAALKDVSVHTLRHSFAAMAAECGFSELTIAGLLGDSVPGVKARTPMCPIAHELPPQTAYGPMAARVRGKDEAEVVPMRA